MSIKKQNVEVEVYSSEEGSVAAYDDVMERKILTKMDICLVPVLCWIYFLSSLDKSNIGNAQLAGLSDSLNLVGNQYGNAVTVMYATYVFFEPLGSNLLKILGPRYMMTGGLVCWGTVTLCTGFVKNYSQLLAVRLLLGLFESCVYPTVNMYLTILFRRRQLAKRFSYVFMASCVASSFGGLIGYGCSYLDGAHGLRGWRWIYIVEGCISLGSIPLVWTMVNQKLENSWFFTEEEKAYIVERYATLDTYDVNEKFSFKEVKKSVLDLKMWISAVMQFSLNLTAYGMGVFFPIIISGMGFSNVRAQLMTVPVYFTTAISYIITARISDKLFIRFPFIIGSITVMTIGLAIVLGSDKNAVRYFGMYFIALGSYSGSSFNLVWLNSNTANYFKRATLVGLNQLVGNCTGLVSGQIFRAQDSPKYVLGMVVCLGGQGLGLLMCILQVFWVRHLIRRNERKLEEARKQGIELVDDPSLGDDNVHFKYVY